MESLVIVFKIADSRPLAMTSMSDFSDAQLDRLLKRRLPAHKDPEPSPDDGLELDLNSGLGDEEMVSLHNHGLKLTLSTVILM